MCVFPFTSLYSCDLEPLLHWWSVRVIDGMSLLSLPHPDSQPIHPSIHPLWTKRKGWGMKWWMSMETFPNALMFFSWEEGSRGDKERPCHVMIREKEGERATSPTWNSPTAAASLEFLFQTHVEHLLFVSYRVRGELFKKRKKAREKEKKIWSEGRGSDLISRDSRPQERLAVVSLSLSSLSDRPSLFASLPILSYS